MGDVERASLGLSGGKNKEWGRVHSISSFVSSSMKFNSILFSFQVSFQLSIPMKKGEERKVDWNLRNENCFSFCNIDSSSLCLLKTCLHLKEAEMRRISRLQEKSKAHWRRGNISPEKEMMPGDLRKKENGKKEGHNIKFWGIKISHQKRGKNEKKPGFWERERWVREKKTERRWQLLPLHVSSLSLSLDPLPFSHSFLPLNF